VNRRFDLIYEVETTGFGLFGDSLDSAWAGFNTQQRQLFQSALRGRLIEVMVNDQFLETLIQNTTSADNVHRRFEMWNGSLRAIIQDPGAAVQRAALLHQKLTQSSVCTVCPQQVTTDDAVLVSVDGGYGVAHRFCRRNQRT
jgi:NAD kinase